MRRRLRDGERAGRKAPHRAAAAACLTLFALCGCGGGESRTPTGVRPDTTGTGGGGGIQRATLTLQVESGPEDTAVARALGWAGRAVPGAVVVVRREGASTADTAVADAAGAAQLRGLLPGQYVVSALRILPQSEIGRLAPADRDVSGFGGGLTVTVRAPSTSRVVPTSAGRRGSLVISEMWNAKPFQPAGFAYYFGDFLELYNNSDTTIHLAGKLLVSGATDWYDHPTFPCHEYEPFIGDSLGIWASYVYRFPPGDFVLGPGEIALVATDALDHTRLAVGTYDLSGARFEFRGGADTDNPAVPDLLSVGTRDGGYIQGHGLYFEGRQVLVLAEALDLGALPRRVYATVTTSHEYIQIPSEKILDVLWWRMSGLQDPGYPSCRSAVHRSLDRQRNDVLPTNDPQRRSLQRAVAYALPDGRRVLLRTRTSARDFLPGTPTPFDIP